MSDADDDAGLIARERDYHLRMLRDILKRRADLASHEQAVVRAARHAGISWNDIAEATGHQDNITAREKYGEPEPGEDPF